MRSIRFCIYDTSKFPFNVQSSAVCQLYWHWASHKAAALRAQMLPLSPEWGPGSPRWSWRKQRCAEPSATTTAVRSSGAAEGEGSSSKLRRGHRRNRLKRGRSALGSGERQRRERLSQSQERAKAMRWPWPASQLGWGSSEAATSPTCLEPRARQTEPTEPSWATAGAAG